MKKKKKNSRKKIRTVKKVKRASRTRKLKKARSVRNKRNKKRKPSSPVSSSSVKRISNGAHPVRNKKDKRRISNGAHKIKIKIIGLGGGAGSMVADIAANYRGASFFVLDTDGNSLSKLKRKKGLRTIQFGQPLTRGMGTGMNPQLGRQAAEKDQQRLGKALQDCDLVVFIACLGGGTGSGAMPVLAKMAKELKILSYGIFTLPFGFEREKKLEVAQKTLRELEPLLNAITIIPNERIFKVIDKKVPLKSALSTINRALGFSLAGLIEMIHNPGIINIDFADLRTILTGQRPLAYLSRVETQDRERIKEFLEKLLNNPLYVYNISGANRVLFNICGSSDLSLVEVSRIAQTITQTAGKRAKVIFGVESKRSAKGLTITLLGVGCEMAKFFPGKEASKKKKKKKKQEKKKEKKVEEKLVKSPLLFKKSKGKNEEEIKEKASPPQAKKPFKKKRKKTSLAKKTKSRKTEKPKTRKNALQIQKAMKEIEEELLEREEKWETPAFLRVNQ